MTRRAGDGEKESGMTHIVVWGPQALKGVRFITNIINKSKGLVLLSTYVPSHVLSSVT